MRVYYYADPRPNIRDAKQWVCLKYAMEKTHRVYVCVPLSDQPGFNVSSQIKTWKGTMKRYCSVTVLINVAANVFLKKSGNI